MACKRKSFKKTEICVADLRHKIVLQSRAMSAVSAGIYEPVETFATIATVKSAIETVEGTRRFAGVAIDKRTTHIFWIRYTSGLVTPEDGNHFILYDARRFRVLRVTNDGEDRKWLAIQCTERGDDSQAAAQA